MRNMTWISIWNQMWSLNCNLPWSSIFIQRRHLASLMQQSRLKGNYAHHTMKRTSLYVQLYIVQVLGMYRISIRYPVSAGYLTIRYYPDPVKKGGRVKKKKKKKNFFNFFF